MGAQALEAVGIDPATKTAISPDPPSDPAGPIAICIEPWQPIFEEFVERATAIVGPDLIEVVTTDDPSLLPRPCFGAIGLEMWVIQIECTRRGIRADMFETMKSLSMNDGMDVDRSWPGYKLIGPDDDWRAMLDEQTKRLVRLRDEFGQRYVKSMLSPSDTGQPTVWSRYLHGDSGQVYAFERVLGVGGTAIVALVRDESGHEYAAKTPSPHRFPVEKLQRRFEREGELLATLDHPNVVRAVDHATMNDEASVLVMEYLPGGSIHARLAQSGPPDLPVAMRWLRDALSGLQAMHAKEIVHRDISLKNLMFRSSGEVVVGDFGTARHLDDVTLTASGDRIGALIYMAPEQLRSPHGVGLEADVYSIGQVGFQLLTGSVPLGNTGPPNSHNPRVPASVSHAVESMRAFHPGDRPGDAAAALGLLSGIDGM